MAIRTRREQVIEVASRLYQRQGYPNASAREVAAAVGLTAPALYRYFPTKQALLEATIGSGLDQVDDALVPCTDLDAALVALAGVAVRRDDLWLLVRRESMHLDVDTRVAVRARLAGLDARLASLVRADRPGATATVTGLAARAAIAAMGAPSQYRLPTDRPRLADLLTGIAGRLCAWEPPDRLAAVASAPSVPAGGPAGGPVGGPVGGPAGDGRRDELLDAAESLFADRGYAGVTLADIGDATGMAGPSLYHHFAGKAEILAGVLQRGIVWVDGQRTLATRDGAEPRRALDMLVGNYAALAARRQALFAVFTTEALHLPRDERQRLARAHERYLQTWVDLAVRGSPQLDPAAARVHVAACMCVVNELVASARARLPMLTSLASTALTG